MNKALKVTLFLAMILSITACKKEKVEGNQPFLLKFNKSAIVTIEGTEHEIKFTKLIDDSRCQPGHYCYVAGSVTIEVSVDKQTYQMGMLNTIPSTIPLGDHSLHFFNIQYSKEKFHGIEKHAAIELIMN